jgi:streptomycin 6-kinase
MIPCVAGGRALLVQARAWARPRNVPDDPWIPRSLQHWRQVPGGREWLERLPAIVDECADAWDLRLGEPYNGGKVGLALRVERADETPAVLKVNFPGHVTHEAAALAHWRGIGAVRLLERDDSRSALLLERCDPGYQLSDLADDGEAHEAAVCVLSRIWRPPPDPHPFPLLADEARRWAEELPRRWKALGRPCERELLDTAVGVHRELGSDGEEAVVCHQDFHGGNVIRSTREDWLTIDPKPVVGERAFDTAWLLRDRRASVGAEAHPRRRLGRRLDLLSSELGLDRERVRAWGIARMLTWGLDADRVHRGHVDCARLLLAV